MATVCESVVKVEEETLDEGKSFEVEEENM